MSQSKEAKRYKLAVIGHPISHSKSPIIHNYWLNKNGLDGDYETIDIAPENLKRDLAEMIAQGYHGFNATIPHKQALLDICDHVDDKAAAIGAVNTVTITDGKLYGTNTDAHGFIANIQAAEPTFSFKDKTALVLGAGGAARAAIYGLIAAGASKVIIANRTIEKARAIQNTMPGASIDAIEWSARESVLPDIDILVNTTSLGMVGHDDLPLSLDCLNPDALVNDIVYAPLYTSLLSNAKTRCITAVTGIGMLLHQAAPAFALWTQITPSVDQELQDKVLR